MGKVLAVAVSAVLAVVLVVVLFGPYFFTSAWFTYLGHGSSPVSGLQDNASVASAEFSNALTVGFPEESVTFNGTHVVYTYTVGKPWTKIVLSDGTVIRKEFDERANVYIVVEKNGEIIKKERLWPSSPIPLTIKYRRTEVADLVHRKAWVVEEAWTEALGLQHYRKIIENTTFTYKWISLAEGGYYDGGLPNVAYLGNNTFKAYISTIKCVEDPLNPGTYDTKPLSFEKTNWYTEIANAFYSTVLSKYFGINLVFEPINQTFMSCTYDPSYQLETTPKINGVPVITAVFNAPREWFTMGAQGNALQLIGVIIIRDEQNIDTYLHELGHQLSFVDVYEMKNPEPYATIFRHSIMWYGGSLSLGDLVVLLTTLYWDAEAENPHDVEAIAEKAMEYGINVHNCSVLLPLTPDNKIPPAINKLIKEGIAKIDPTNPENTKTNTQLLNLLKTITKLTQNNTS